MDSYRLRTTKAWLAAALVAQLSGAQPVAPEDPAGGAANVDPETLSPGQLGSVADSYLESMGTTLAELRGLHATAKDEKDVVKTLCLDDKADQSSAAVETAIDRRAALREAIENGALEQARHEFTLIGVLAERVTTLWEEANQCIGEETTFTADEESLLELSVTSILPNVDADTLELPPTLLVVPAVKSPVD